MTPAVETRTYVLFRLGEEGFALPVESVTGVVRFDAPTPVPRAPRSIMGVVNMRGRVLPVIDLKVRFGSEPFSPGPLARIVVAVGGDGPVGVAVDAVTEVASFAVDELKALPEGVLADDTTGAFVGMVERGERLVIVLDPEHALHAHAPGTTTGGAIDDRKEDGSHV